MSGAATAATAALGCAIALAGAARTPQPAAIAVQAKALLDLRSGRTIDDAVVVTRGDRIEYAGRAWAAAIPSDATRIDLGAVTLLPGLIDAHVHLTLGGAAEANARATLEAGFTTVQDLGAVDDAVFRLRRDIDAGRVAGPRIRAAGRWIGVSGGTCDFNGIGVRGAAAFRARVRDEIRRGADVIKVCVSGWLGDARRDPARYEISDDELRAAIDETHKGARPVAVHAISAGSVGAAVRLGADLVVHSAFADAPTVALMRKRKVSLLPTLLSFSRAQPEPDVEAIAAHVREAIRAGLPVAFGTDAGVIAHGRNAREFEWLVRLELSPLDALRAATTHAARALRLEGRAGELRKGAWGDVIAVEGDPLQDVTALQRVVYVMSRGATVKRPPPATSAPRG